MKWRGRERSSNIEDRRRAGRARAPRVGSRGFSARSFPGGRLRLPTGRGGIGGIVVVLVVLGLFWALTGQNPLDAGSAGNSAPGVDRAWPAPQAGADELADFVGVVVKETETLWSEVFRENGMSYAPAVVVLYSGTTASGCGAARSASGPFYCPSDRRVYIDLVFYDQLRDRFGAPGDFAQAYVIAHEIGHHVQQLTGVLGEFNARRSGLTRSEQNAYSVRIELMADCYAGIWANYAGREALLEAGDVEEAMRAANAVGDDALTGNRADPREYTHGSAAQRMSWFRRGFETGDVGQCDTLAGAL